MRSTPSPTIALLVGLLMLISGPASLLAVASPGPMDSPVRYSAGFVNETFTDTNGQDLTVTYYYPARAEGEDTIKVVTGAPYPGMLLVPDPALGAPFELLRSYGEHLSRRGFVVGLMDLGPYDGTPATEYDDMVTAALDALAFTADMHDTSGYKLYGMVNTSAMAVAGLGQGAWVALTTALRDGSDAVAAIACIELEGTPGAGQPSWDFVGALDQPILLMEAAHSPAGNSHDAFNAKSSGYVGLLNIEGANRTQFLDNTTVPWGSDPPADINHTEQMRLAKGYLLAFLDFHLKDDAGAWAKVYGNEAAADLAGGILAEWRAGVRDQRVEVVRPTEGQAVPPGPLAICATVSNVGPFSMPSRNVTLEVAKVVGGGPLTRVFGPENRTSGAMLEGGSATLRWTPLLSEYGDYVAFVDMGDPDHNTTNDRVELGFTVAPLLPPTISHVPPEQLELGEPYNFTCQLGAPSGIVDAFLNYTDEEGFRQELPLTEDAATGDWYVVLKAPRSTGQVSYKVHALAGNGARNVTNPYYIPVVDSTPPAIAHQQVYTELPVLSSIEICATVTDVGGMDEVRLLYTEPAAGSRNASCGREGDRWFYPLDLGPVAGELEYSFFAMDNWGNFVTSPSYTVSLVDAGPPVIEPTVPGPIEIGGDLLLQATVTEDSQLDGVWVLYTPPGSDQEVNATPERLGDTFRLTVEDLTVAGTLAYAWWARDVNGHTVTSGPMEVAVVDTEAPSISDIDTGDALVGAAPWVQATVTDDGGVASVSLEYTGIEGVDGTVVMEEVLPGLYEAHLPVQTRAGGVVYRVVALDPSGNEASTGDRNLVVRDVDPPVLSHVPPQDLIEGDEVTFELEVTDNVGVTEVWLYLRLTAAASYRRLSMEPGGGDSYSYTLEAGQLQFPHVMYYFEAEDMPPSSNVARDPDGAPQVTYLLNVTERELSIGGVVRESGGEPIKGATVRLVGHDDPVQTDVDGAYSFTGLLEGSYIIEAKAEGYQTFSSTVILTLEGGDRTLDISLVPKQSTGGEEDGLSWALLLAAALFVTAAIIIVMVVRSRPRRG